MSQLSLLPLRALPYSSVGDEAYQSSSHHIRKRQKKQVKLLGLLSPNLDFRLSLLTSSKHLMATLVRSWKKDSAAHGLPMVQSSSHR